MSVGKYNPRAFTRGAKSHFLVTRQTVHHFGEIHRIQRLVLDVVEQALLFTVSGIVERRFQHPHVEHHVVTHGYQPPLVLTLGIGEILGTEPHKRIDKRIQLHTAIHLGHIHHRLLDGFFRYLEVVVGLNVGFPAVYLFQGVKV